MLRIRHPATATQIPMIFVAAHAVQSFTSLMCLYLLHHRLSIFPFFFFLFLLCCARSYGIHFAGRYVGSRPIKLRKSSWRQRSFEVVKRKEKEKTQLLQMFNK